MGYSHSWYRDKEIEAAEMSLIVADFIQLRKSFPKKSEVVDASDFKGAARDIAFRGKFVTCEPMIFCRVSSARCITQERAREPWQVGKYFEFCKTDKMPYDLAVQSLLIIVKNRLVSGIRVFTDGSDTNWLNAKEFCDNFIGYGRNFFIDGYELIKSAI